MTEKYPLSNEELISQIEDARWKDATVSVGETPLQQWGMQEVGLYNGILSTLDRIVSRLPHHPFIEKFRIYAGSQFAKDPHHADKFDTMANPDNKKKTLYKFWSDHKKYFYSNFFSPDSVRARRRLCIQELQAINKNPVDWNEASDEIIRKIAYLDAIGYQLVNNQRVIRVKSELSGEVSSIITMVKSPIETPKNEPSPSKKPLAICVTGYGNDTGGGIPLMVEIALNGQDVYHLSYPDSYHKGTMDQKFIDLVKNSPGLFAHAEYFKACVREIIKQNPDRKIELWGQSTGSLVWATALSDPEFAKLIDGAVLIHPAGATDVENQAVEFVKEGKNVAASLSRMGMYQFVIGAHDAETPQAFKDSYPFMLAQSIAENVMLKGDRGKVWRKVMSVTRRRQPVYDTMRLKDGKKILRVNGNRDTTTMSFTRKEGPNEISKTYPGTHADTNLYPDVLVPQIMKWKENPD